MSRESRRLWLLVLACGCVRAASGIAPDMGLDTKYPFVGMCGGGSGTAISARSMITARHVPGVLFEVQGRLFTAAQRINHPVYDLAIFNFDSDLPGWHPLGFDAPIGMAVELAGYGGVGYLNSSHTGYDIRFGNHGRHSAGAVLDHKWNIDGIGPSNIMMLWDHPQAAGVGGDSGGGCFANGRLVGVIAFAFNLGYPELPNYGFAILNGGAAYHGTGAIDLTHPEVRAWVRANAI